MWRLLGDLVYRLRALFAREEMDADLQSELAHHVAMETGALRAEGMSEADAEREARRRLHSMTAQRETASDGWGVRAVHDLFGDVRHAFRQMRRRPGFTAIAILTVGLGIGATVALGSVAHGVIVRALPFADEERIRVFWDDYDWRGEEYDFLKDRRGVFSDLAAFSTNGEPYVADPASNAGARSLPFVVATASLFDVLGVRPAMGPGFTADDDRPTAPKVIVISHGMWQDDLGGDPQVIGRRILVGGEPVTIVGVMPKGFYFPTPEFRAWRPAYIDAASPMYRVGYLVLVGRTRIGVADALVDTDVQRIARDLGGRFTYPKAWDKTKNAHVTPVHAYMLGNVRDPMLLLLAAVILLLAIAAANTAALVLARTSDRGHEMVVRTAMGAGSWRLVRQICAESLVLALAAACLGAAVAAGGFQFVVSRLPLANGFGATMEPGIGIPAIAFVLALVIACAISIAPARGLLRRRFDTALTRERRDAGLRAGTRRAHGLIIATQVALAIMLAAGASLLIHSVDRIRALDPGFDANGVMSFGLIPPASAPAARNIRFVQDMVDSVARLPGVTAAGLVNRLPIRDGGYQGGVGVEGRPDLDGALRPNALYRVTTPGFFAAMRMRIAEGRGIDSTDNASSNPVAVVSESFARAMWPGESALGKHVTSGWTGTLVRREIVGVVRETKLTSMTGQSAFAMFVPFEQSPSRSGAVLAVRTGGSTTALVPQVRAVAAKLDPMVAVARVESMDDVVAASLAQPLRLRFFLGVFATLAILLAVVGVYGTVSYAVARRRGELGILLALGATPARILRDVLRRALAPVSIGVAAGLGGTLLAGNALRGFLYGVAPTDSVSLVAAGSVLIVAAALAAFAPAMRASRTSPAESLRAE